MRLGVIIYNGNILKVTIDNPTSNYNDILVSYVIQFLLKTLYVSVLEHSFFKLTEQFTVSYNKIGCKHSCKKSNIYMYFKKQFLFYFFLGQNWRAVVLFTEIFILTFRNVKQEEND